MILLVFKYSRDITILIVLLCFSFFYWSTIVPTLAENFEYISLLNWLTDEPTRSKVVMVPHTSIISESEVSIAVLCLLCSPRYTAVRIKYCSKSTSVIKVTTMKDTNDFSLCKGSHHMQPPNSLFTVSKDEWNTKEDTGKSVIAFKGSRILLRLGQVWKENSYTVLVCEVHSAHEKYELV